MNKNTKRIVGILLGLLTLLPLFGLMSCNNDSGLECGEGTIFDETTNTCISDGSSDDPGFNGVIGSATLGDFTLTNLSFPDRLVPGVEQEHSVTITNKTTSKSALTMIRVSMAEGEQSAIDQYVKKAAGVGTVCSTAACTSSSILNSCTLTQDPKTSAITNERGSCGTGYYCHPVSKLCFLKLIPVAAFPVEELAAGASISKTYKIALPGDWTNSAPKTLIYTVGEETLSYNAKGEIISPANASLPAAEDSIVRAKGVVLAGPTEVYIPFLPDLTVVDVKVDNNSFELDTSNTTSQPAFIVNARFMAVGRDLKETPEIGFRLKIPGMVQTGCTWNGASNYGYKKDRGIGITVDCPTCTLRNQPQVNCSGDDCEIRVRPYQAECQKTNTCSDANPPIVWKSGQIVDGTFRIFITESYKKLLSATLDRKDINPDLTSFNELPGKLSVRIREANNKLGYPSEKELNVVFLPPPAAAVAKESDPLEPTDQGTEENDRYASDYPNGVYPEADELTPTLYDMFGSEWAGASYQVKNISSKERLHQAVVKQALLADNYFKLHIFEGTIDLLKLSADVDLSTRRNLSDNKASGEVVVPTIMNGTDLIGKLLGFTGDKQLMDTLVSFDFEPGECKEKDGIESCMIWGGEDDPSNFGDITINTGIELPDSEKSISYEASKEKTVCKGPLCFTAAISVSFTVGIRGALGFVRDSSNAPEYSTGIEATLGVFASADGSASGELSVILASIAIVGDVNFLSAQFTPTLRLGIVQQLESDRAIPCWWTNTGRITFEGPASVEALSGEVRIEAYIGREIDLGFFTINLREKVFEFTLVDWDPVWSKSWMLWSESKDFCGGSGLCTDAPNPSIVWKTPIGCKAPTGADGYCNSAIPYDKNGSPLNPWILPQSSYHGRYVGRFYLGPSHCGTLVVNGSVDRWTGSTYVDTSNCLVGDAFNMVYGPSENGSTSDFRDSPTKHEIYPEDPSVCRWEVRNQDGSVTTVGGTVFCGPKIYAADAGARENSMRMGPYSGNFSNTRFRFCPHHNELEDNRWIDLFLKTDDAGTSTGLTVKLELQEGAESAIYSDDKWFAMRIDESLLQSSWRLLEGDSKALFRRAYASGSLYSDPWYGRPIAPFDWSDSAKAKWIWWGSTLNSYAGYAFFRRPFLAAKGSYTAAVRCDNECEVYLDGQKVATNKNWDSPTVFTVTTEPLHMHMLAIKARNLEDGGAQGLNFMMK